ncbi:MAG: hypothetical protein WCJ64_06320 [Rhodospirillaceae bacterium]
MSENHENLNETPNSDDVSANTINMAEEERYFEESIREELRLDDGEDIEVNGNPILALISELAASDDLLRTQRTIIAYESGDGPLFRTLGGILNIGERIVEADLETIKTAFTYLRAKLVDEMKNSTDEKRPNRGIRNIGVPTMPVADQKFFKRMKEDALFVYKTLVTFYFPSLSPSMRTQYYTVLNWAHLKHEPNFVTWLAGKHEVTIKGVKTFKNGMRGAYLFVRATEPPPIEKGRNADDIIAKAFDSTTKRHVVEKPEWLEECVEDFDEPFMMMGKVVDNRITFVNYVSTNESQMKDAIRGGHGSLFPTDLDCESGSANAINSNMVTAIKNLVPFSGAPELILWQDSTTTTFVMPLYDAWINDGQPNIIHKDPSTHFAAIVNLFDAYDHKEMAKYAQLMLPDAVDAETDFDESILEVGFVTNQLSKVLEFKGNLKESFKLNEEETVLEFMGAQWMLATNRRAKRQNDIDKELKRTRQPAIPAYGYRYISACRHYIFSEEGEASLTFSRTIGKHVDFGLARAVYKKWSECRKKYGQREHPEYLTICMRNGVIGMWYDNVISEDIIYYDNRDELVPIGTVSETYSGQWRVPSYQLRRVWNLITGPWEFYFPHNIQEVMYHPEPPMTFLRLTHVIARDSERNLPLGRMKNLCSTREIDDGIYNFVVKQEVDGQEVETSVVERKCFPVILRCGALWLYIFNETR